MVLRIWCELSIVTWIKDGKQIQWSTAFSSVFLFCDFFSVYRMSEEVIWNVLKKDFCRLDDISNNDCSLLFVTNRIYQKFSNCIQNSNAYEECAAIIIIYTYIYKARLFCNHCYWINRSIFVNYLQAINRYNDIIIRKM